MLAKTTISDRERTVLRNAVLADLPDFNTVLAAFEDIDQRYAHELHDRFMSELQLLGRLGWRTIMPGEHHELHYCDASPVDELTLLFARELIVVRDHLIPLDDRPLRLLEACGPILTQLAAVACPQPETGEHLNEQLVAMAERFRETVRVAVGDAGELKEALRIDVSLADVSNNTERRHRDEAQQLVDALRAGPHGGDVVVVVDTCHDSLSRTITRISLRATEDLHGQAVAEQAIEHSLVVPAIETLAAIISLFDRLVQESAGDDEAEGDDEPDLPRDKTVNSRLAALGRASRMTRVAMRMPVREVADNAGLTPSYIRAIEHASVSPTYLTVCKLAEALRLTPIGLVAIAVLTQQQGGARR